MKHETSSMKMFQVSSFKFQERGHVRLNRILSIISVGGILFLFFVLYSYLAVSTLSGSIIRFNSPDETANFFFSKLYAEKSTFSFEESALALSKNFVHPRSMTAVVDKVAPVSFLGMTALYGLVGKLTGANALLFLTPLIAVFTVPFFYLLVRMAFSKTTALFSCALLLVHPAYWYYASRSMMNNVLFVDFAVIGFSLLLCFKRTVLKFAGGLMIGLSLMVRFSEVIWIAGLLVLLLAFCIRRIRISNVCAAAAGVCIPIVALLALNNMVYGNPLSFGYQTVDTGPAIISLEKVRALLGKFDAESLATIASHVSAAIASITSYILPFGFLPQLFLQNFYDYEIAMFWWLVIPMCFGLISVVLEGVVNTFRKKRLDNRLIWLLSFLGVSVWLVIFYGSWLFHDNITKSVTIGNSYVRYWLPITLLALPFAGSCLAFLARHSRNIPRALVFASLCGVIVFYSFRATITDGTESLATVASELSGYREKALRMNEITEQNAIIFSERSDKIFFPDRRAAQVFNSFAELPLVPDILKKYPVYYYGFWEQKDADYVSRRYFEPLGLKLIYIDQFDTNERLFKIERS